MEMKEFYYENGIRVSLFNLDHEAVPFHFHQSVSDMIFCSKGTIQIELPEKKKVYTVAQGNVFQIPSRTKHRFANGEQHGRQSRYVLMQLGSFDIEFEQDTESMQALLPSAKPKHESKTPIYIENRKADIQALASRFAKNRPEALTEEENRDVVMALEYFAAKGVESVYSDEKV
ncbi:cupin domain-containing protein [Vibrio maritimus]|uniref:cupin domain-containing protein n=1 Tax=Vibrio maritimus TaxID=990268 RepID=UPI001F1D4C70|nr:cupin domain-containing protein [Vibrio maritimus]